MINNLTLICQATNCNGYPYANVKIDDSTVYDGLVDDCENKFNFDIPSNTGRHTLTINRYGKTNKNVTAECEQLLKIVGILIDGVSIPKHVLVSNSKFQYQDTTEHGSLELYPNGTWTFDFETPFITWCMDQKIANDAEFSNNYLLPWSYQLGPNQADQLIDDIDQLFEKLKVIHD